MSKSQAAAWTHTSAAYEQGLQEWANQADSMPSGQLAQPQGVSEGRCQDVDWTRARRAVAGTLACRALQQRSSAELRRMAARMQEELALLERTHADEVELLCRKMDQGLDADGQQLCQAVQSHITSSSALERYVDPAVCHVMLVSQLAARG